jgi:hypothetical protein
MAAGSISNQNMRDMKPGLGGFIHIMLLKSSSIHLAIHFVVELSPKSQRTSFTSVIELPSCTCIAVAFSCLYRRTLDVWHPLQALSFAIVGGSEEEQDGLAGR